MENLRFVDLSTVNDVPTLQEFEKNQGKKRQEIENQISEYSRECRESFKQGIDAIIEKVKEDINDEKTQEEDQNMKYPEPVASTAKNENLNSERGQALEKIGFKPDLMYKQRAELRDQCSRFLRFSYLLDFIAMDALTNIYLNSV